jgi:cation transport ATPase
LEKQLVVTKANLDASEAHCTIMKRAVSDAMSQMELQKRKSGRPVKTKAHLVACPGDPEHEAQFAASQEEKARVAREAKEKEAQKAAEEAQRQAQLQEAIRMWIFTGAWLAFILALWLASLSDPVSSYKRKDDLIVLASALGLKATGTVIELSTNIKSYLALQPEIQHEARFAALFLTSGVA